jgi:hypothetical protein
LTCASVLYSISELYIAARKMPANTMPKSPKPEPPTADIIDIIQAICRPSEPQSKWVLTKFKTPMSKSTKSAAAPVELSLKDLREIQYSLIKGIVDSDDTTRAGWTAFKLPDNREVQTNMAVLASVNSTVLTFVNVQTSQTYTANVNNQKADP